MDDRTESEYEKGTGSNLSELREEEREEAEAERDKRAREYTETLGGSGMAIDGVKIESDEGRYLLILEVDDLDDLSGWTVREDGGFHLSLALPLDEAEKLVAAVKPIREWLAARDEVRADFDHFKRTGVRPDYAPQEENR